MAQLQRVIDYLVGEYARESRIYQVPMPYVNARMAAACVITGAMIRLNAR